MLNVTKCYICEKIVEFGYFCYQFVTENGLLFI